MTGGVYIHVPFCRRRCPYCDFAIVPSDGSRERERAYVSRVTREMEDAAASRKHLRAETIYLGGGTPSMLAPESVRNVVLAAKRLFRIEKGAEITLEANPEDLTRSRLGGYREAGINRLSIGAQSFHDDDLRLLGRSHSAKEARDAVLAARMTGFKNISRETLSQEQIEIERIMLGIRRSEGIAASRDFRDRHKNAIDECVKEGAVELLDGRLRLTRRGRIVADTVIERFAAP